MPDTLPTSSSSGSARKRPIPKRLWAFIAFCVPLLLFLVFIMMRMDRQAIQKAERSFNEQQLLQVTLAANAIRDQIGLISRSVTKMIARHDGITSTISETLFSQWTESNKYILAVMEKDEVGTVFHNIKSPELTLQEMLTVAQQWGEQMYENTTPRALPLTTYQLYSSNTAQLLGMLVPSTDGHGVFVVIVDLGTILEQYIKPLRSGQYGAGYSLDGLGVILYDHETSIVGRSIFDGMHDAYPSVLDVDRRLLSEVSGKAEYTFPVQRGGTVSRKLIAWNTVRLGTSHKIIVALSAPDEELTQGMSDLRLLYILIGLLVAASIAGIGAAIHRSRYAQVVSANEQALSEQLAFTQSLINAVPNPIYFKDLNFTYMGCNEAFAQFADSTPDAIIGKTDTDIFDKETMDLFQTIEKRMLINWTNKSGQLRLIKDGKKYIHDLLVSPLRTSDNTLSGIVGSMRDITPLHETLDKYRTSEMRHRAIFEHSGMGIALLDLNGHIVSANNTLAYMVQQKASSLTGQRFFSLVGSGEDDDLDIALADLVHQRRPRWQIEEVLSCPNGTTIWAALNLTTILSRFKKPQYVLVMIEDITTRKKAEYELEQLNLSLEHLVLNRTQELEDKATMLEQANERLTQLDTIKSNFVSSVSHELRTPLTSLLGFSKIIRKAFNRHFMPLTAEYPAIKPKAMTIDQNLGILVLEGERLTRLIDNVLDLKKIEAGKMHWDDAMLDMEEVVRQAASNLGGYCETNPDVQLRLTFADNISPIKADWDKLLQVVINLLTNSFKHTAQGCIAVLVESPVPDHIRMVVADTGTGIATEELQPVFTEFHQASHTDILSVAATGTGLGLPICKHIVTHYNGLIWAESTLGNGSCFTIELPTNNLSDDESEV